MLLTNFPIGFNPSGFYAQVTALLYQQLSCIHYEEKKKKGKIKKRKTEQKN